MKKVKIKAPAKVNLTLDVLGVTGGYHDIKSLVASIDVYDEITLRARKDSTITLECTGLNVGCETFDNNAYKAAKSFIKKFSTHGVDIKIKKNIPIGAGLGGSSADIAGVLNGMKSLYQVKGSLLSIANDLGSDSGYMLSGGFAVITGRGEKVHPKDIKNTLYLLFITEDKSITARASYKACDKLEKIFKPCTSAAEKALKDGDREKFYSVVKNDLYYGSKELLPEMQGNIFVLKKAGAPTALMTGSGSAVYGVFFDKARRDGVYKKLLPIYGSRLIKAQTIEPR